MKASVILAASGAILAAASPIVLQERKLYTEIDIETAWVTVTVTGEPQFFRGTHATPVPEVPVPEPTTSSEAPPPPPPAPEPTTYAPPPPPPPPPAPTTPAYVAPPPPPPPPKKVEEPTPAPPQAPVGDDYKSIALHYHNVHRVNHSAPALTWSDKHAEYARQVAQSCVFKHDMNPGKAQGDYYGQNLAMFGASNAQPSGGPDAMAKGVNDGWYNGEVNKYPRGAYGNEPPNDGTFSSWGHFSQLVWKGTQQVGCYTQYCQAGTIVKGMPSFYTVCNYFPRGNMGGGYAKNVIAPSGQPTAYTEN